MGYKKCILLLQELEKNGFKPTERLKKQIQREIDRWDYKQSGGYILKK